MVAQNFLLPYLSFILLIKLTQGYGEPKCWRRFNIGSANPAPIFCPIEDFFTRYECCDMDYGECCPQLKVMNLIVLILICIGLLGGVCCCCIFIFTYDRKRKGHPAPSKNVPITHHQETIHDEVEVPYVEIHTPRRQSILKTPRPRTTATYI
uniref:CX domain-containing protein n=1 Tax=Rhabditophanes sp. KR3021 TaxID=114890 RepID=A0AC35TZG5_9BILA